MFTRKPLWGYRLAVAGMLGIAFLSFFVWQHHLFVSGHQRRPAAVLHALHRADLAADRVHLPVRDGDAVARANTVHRADAVLPGVGVQLPVGRDLGRVQLRRPQRRDHARQLLRDGPLPLHDHGRPGVRLLRRRSTTGSRRCTASSSTRRSRKIHFWVDVHRVQLDVRAAVRARLLGMPRRVVTYPTRTSRRSTTGCRCRRTCSGSRCWCSCTTWCGRSLFKREPAEVNPWHVQVARVAAAHAGAGPRLRRASRCSAPTRIRTASSPPARRRRRRRPAEVRRRWKPPPRPGRVYIEPEPPEWQPRRDLGGRAACCAARSRSSSSRSCSPTSTCGRSTPTTAGRSASPPVAWAGGWRSWRCSCRRRGHLPAGGEAAEVDE